MFVHLWKCGNIKNKFMKILKKILRIAGWTMLCIIVFAIAIHLALVIFIKPSLNRDWTADQQVLARATFEADGSDKANKVTITNIRNIKYRSTTDYDVAYYDKTFDLSKLNSVWYMVEPFSGHGAGAAHTLLSFGFENGDYVAVSVEIRKEKGESFSPVKGLLRQYELVYVIADERDVIKLRSNYRKDEVYLYPVQTSKEHMRELFVSMLKRANKLATEPEFYNTLTSTCTTNIVSHINDIVPGRVPLSFKVLMPAYSDQLAYDIGLLDNSLPFLELRAKYHINERAMRSAVADASGSGNSEDINFSRRIRE